LLDMIPCVKRAGSCWVQGNICCATTRTRKEVEMAAKRAQTEAKLQQLIAESKWDVLVGVCEQYEFEVCFYIYLVFCARYIDCLRPADYIYYE
jgi:hypothetical protein